MVSVPLRGLWFLSEEKKIKQEVEKFGFRPLAGIMFLISKGCSEHTGEQGVSVPLRGLWFLSAARAWADQYEAREVSVPLRGLWFLSFRNQKIYFKERLERFPSPCGDYGSYRNTEYDDEKIIKIVSVPLRGLWFLSFS